MLSASRVRVSSFSLSSSAFRACNHSSWLTILGSVIPVSLLRPALLTRVTETPEGQSLPEGIDVPAALNQVEQQLPGMLQYMEPDAPGMHTTPTVDFEVVLEGEVWLELEDGKEVHLRPGDCVVQNGTRHAWRNRTSEPCTMLSILVGARRS